MELTNGIAAVVTGAASGLGEATARALAKRGVSVAIFDLSDRGQDVADSIGGNFCKVDVTSEDSVTEGFAKARAAHGQERVLVNCAGTGNAIKTAGRNRDTGEIRTFPMDQFEKIIQINLLGTFRCVAQSAAGMLTLDPIGEDGERGAIINTASVAAVDGQMGQAAYSASKAGVVGMTLPIARDLASEGVRINTILPGIFATPLMLGAQPAVLESLAAQVPFPRRLGNPAEFAKMAIAMIETAYLNGEHLRLDGSIRMGFR